MKLGICCNFTHPSIGGSEIVCKAIAEGMANTYGMDVTTFGYNVGKDFTHNKVKYKKCLKGNYFLEQIQDLDHLFIYSDSFWGFETIQNNLDFMRPTLSIALLGMYAMHDNSLKLEIFKQDKQHFRVITHSNSYQDYKKCFEHKIPVTVIPNGVNAAEFEFKETMTFNMGDHRQRIAFRRRHGLDNQRIVLNVSNYFYGKGQEHLLNIGNKLYELSDREDDFTIVQISNTVKYPHDKPFFNKTKDLFKKKAKFKYKFLRDIPREEVASAFNAAEVCVLTSLKEIAPIVLLESMASLTPWVSMDVGNVEELSGGLVVHNNNHDSKGYKIMTDEIESDYARCINLYLNSMDMSEDDAVEGLEMIERFYNWDKICEQYYNIFIG